MSKIKVVNTGRGRPRGGRGGKLTTAAAERGRGRSVTTARTGKAGTPVPRTSTTPSGLRLKINFSRDAGSAPVDGGGGERAESHVSVAFEGAEGEVDDETVYEHTGSLVAKGDEVDGGDVVKFGADGRRLDVSGEDDMRRSGRAVGEVQYDDLEYGLGEPEADEQEHDQIQEDGSQCNTKLQVPQIAQPASQKRADAQPLIDKRGHTPSPILEGIHELKVDDKIYEIMNFLKCSPKIVIDLPDLADQERDRPYTATILMHIYLLAYQSGLWNICDLIADTWIRAFHAQRTRGASDPDERLWRRNSVLERRQASFREAKKQGRTVDEPAEFDKDAPEYHLNTQDPRIASDVVFFDSSLLNELYQFTNAGCGARLLWADAMVLAGDKTQRMFHDTVKRGFEWNAQLQFDVMSISLRMLRRKLTLKIEESTEGAWCARYHEHGKHEPKQPCYRALAATQVEDFEDEDAQNNSSSDEDEMEALMRAELAEEEDRPAKRAKFA